MATYITGGCKETQCTHCIHKDICSKKEDFLRAQKAVDNTFVGLGDNSGIYLRDITWIEPVNLSCKHFYHELVTRDRNILGTVDLARDVKE